MRKHRFNNIIATVLVAVIIIPMLVQFCTIEVMAAGSSPSVTAFATKEQLTTSYDLDGTTSDKVVQDVYFGKNDSGSLQEWYIAGKDSETGGLVLIAASPLVTNKQFNASPYTNKTYSYAANTGYGDTAGTIEVYANHYGVSDLLVSLKAMETDTTYFSTEEQALMQNTTVKTTDILNSITYTITGKLYAPMGTNWPGSDKKNERFYVGSDDSLRIELLSGPYASGSQLWSRAAYTLVKERALVIRPGVNVRVDGVNGKYGISPAFSLDLSSVLMAATTPAGISITSVSGSDSIAGNTMTIRYDGSEKLSGSAAAYASEKIKVKPAEGKTVTLVVQGNDGSKDWYYATPIESEVVLTAESIQTAVGLSATPDMKDCKIWIETTENDLAYAKMAAPIQEIGTVTISDIDMPIGGQAFDSVAACATTGVAGVSEVTWTLADGTAVSGNVKYGTAYKITLTLTPEVEYVFSTATTAKVGNEEAECSYDTATGKLTVTYTYPETGKEKLISITAPSSITGVASGTAKTAEALGLPKTVGVVTEGNSVTNADVAWDLDNLASGSYDPSVLTEQTFTINGTVTLPETIDGSGVELKTQITVTVAAAGITGVPTASPVAGTYVENQSIVLSSSTADAVFYYTTDGSEPTKSSNQYTTPIEVKGEAGTSVTTTIRAIAVKDGMQDSPVGEFTYVIQLPSESEEDTDGEDIDGEDTDGEETDGEETGGEDTDGEETDGEETGGEDTDGKDKDEDNTDVDNINKTSTGIHSCSYEWKIVKKATARQDGEEVYRCIYCGNVKEHRAISSYEYFNKEVKARIQNAPENGTVEVTTDIWISYVDYVLKALEERCDITLVTTFRYQGKEYRFTIPARKSGTDANILVEEDVKYYGFLYLSGKYGLKEVMDKK